MSHDYIPLLIKAVWPVTTLIILFWFRKELRQLLRRMLQVSIPGTLAALFGEGPSDDRAEREPRRPTPPTKAAYAVNCPLGEKR
jgi:hypothetical protein